MHYNSQVAKHHLIIPEGVIKNDSIKNLLSVYLALYVMDNPIPDKNYWTSITGKRLRDMTGVYKGVSNRTAQVAEMCGVVKALEQLGYVETDGLDINKPGESFRYRVLDVAKSDGEKNKNRFVNVGLSEYIMLMRTMQQYEGLSHRLVDTVLRLYFCLRLYMNMWQRTYKDKYAAWVGRVDSAGRWLGLSKRTQSRVFNLLQDMGILFVTYGAQKAGTSEFGERSDTIAVFPFVESKYAPITLTSLVQLRVRDKKDSKNDQWYAPGSRRMEKDTAPNGTETVVEVMSAETNELPEQYVPSAVVDIAPIYLDDDELY